MKNELNWAIALYLLSFFLPVIEIPSEFGSTDTYYGWQAAWKVMYTYDYGPDNLSDTNFWMTMNYIVANLTNPLVFLSMILYYSKKVNPQVIWYISLIPVFTSIYWSPIFISKIFDYFSYGYWLWVISILLIHFYMNKGTFKRPAKNA